MLKKRFIILANPNTLSVSLTRSLNVLMHLTLQTRIWSFCFCLCLVQQISESSFLVTWPFFWNYNILWKKATWFQVRVFSCGANHLYAEMFGIMRATTRKLDQSWNNTNSFRKNPHGFPALRSQNSSSKQTGSKNMMQSSCKIPPNNFRGKEYYNTTFLAMFNFYQCLTNCPNRPSFINTSSTAFTMTPKFLALQN